MNINRKKATHCSAASLFSRLVCACVVLNPDVWVLSRESPFFFCPAYHFLFLVSDRV